MAILIGCGSNNSSNSFSVSVGEDKISVLDKNVTISATINGDYNGTLSYEWREGEKLLGNGRELTKDDFSQGKHLIQLTVTTSNGLKASDSMILKVGAYVLVDEWIQQQGGNIKHNSYAYDNRSKLIKLSSDYVDEDENRKPDGIIDNITYYTYDNKGNLLKEEETQTDGGFSDYIYYTYDKNNNLLKAVYKNGNIKTYSYNENGRVISYTYNVYKIIVLNEKYTYDKNGNRLTFSYSQSAYGEEYNSTTTYTYNTNNQLVSQRLIFENPKQHFMIGGDASKLPNWDEYGINYITYNYNQNGKILSKNYYADETLSKKITYSYEDNKVIEYFWQGGVIYSTRTYIYNSHQKLISKEIKFNGKVYHIYTYEYDEKLNIIEQKEHSFSYKDSGELLSESESINTYENFYDELGTLIKVIQDEKYSWEKVLMF